MSDTVWTITDLGPTDSPGMVVPAELAGLGPGFGPIPIWRYDPWAGIDPGMPQHTNHRCDPQPQPRRHTTR